MRNRKKSRTRLIKSQVNNEIEDSFRKSQRNIPTWAKKTYMRQRQKFMTESSIKKPNSVRRSSNSKKDPSSKLFPKKAVTNQTKPNMPNKRPPLLKKRNGIRQPKPKKLVNGKYTVLKEIGRGASAIVYLVKHFSSGDFFAAKVFNMADLAFSEKFENLEVRLVIVRMKLPPWSFWKKIIILLKSKKFSKQRTSFIWFCRLMGTTIWSSSCWSIPTWV